MMTPSEKQEILDRVRKLEASVFTGDEAEQPKPRYKVGDRLWDTISSRWHDVHAIEPYASGRYHYYRRDGIGLPESALRPNQWGIGKSVHWDGRVAGGTQYKLPHKIEVTEYRESEKLYLVGGIFLTTEEHLFPLPMYPIGSRVRWGDKIGEVVGYNPEKGEPYTISFAGMHLYHISESDLSLAHEHTETERPEPVDEPGITETDKLKARIKNLETLLNKHQKLVESQRERIRDLEYYLAETEWSAGEKSDQCPFCGWCDLEGHAPNCGLVWVLNKEGGVHKQ